MFPLVEVNGVLQSLQIQIPKAVLLGAILTTMHNEAGYDEQEEKGLKEIENGELQTPLALHGVDRWPEICLNEVLLYL